jgi:endonuclease YncB( thermonuclease family)
MTTTRTVNRLRIIASVLGAVLWVANDARWFDAIADATKDVPVQTIISGPARVIDGETVSVAGTRIRLIGLDVAETGTRWGDMAKTGLEMLNMFAGSQLSCHLTGEKFHGMEVGTCTIPDGTDIAEVLVRQGWALACPRYDDRYVKFEEEGKRSELGKFLQQPRSSYCAKRGAP